MVNINTLEGSFYINEAVQAAINYCLENDIMSEYLKNNEREIIDTFGYEWNEQKNARLCSSFHKPH